MTRKILESPMALQLLLLLGVLVIYMPGAYGVFLFDDFWNLQSFVQHGPIDSFDSLMVALGNSSSGPTGRPISVLTFLLNGSEWPVEPFSYKFVNILVHALNSVLLYALLSTLLKPLAESPDTVRLVSFLAACFWAFHPLWISTTLYVIQRMAMLSATFQLAALLLYVRGRLQLIEGNVLGAYLRMGLAGVGFGTLALLSKENGIVLPLLVMALEYTIFSNPALRSRIAATPPIHQRLIWLVLALPVLAAVAYIWLNWQQWAIEYDVGRSFSLSERLMTEARVIFLYLGLLFVPRSVTNGIFYDDYQYSASLTAPWTTLPSLFGIAVLFALVLYTRSRAPLVSLAILFFLAGHALESTFIPLELVFEHRNYLPAVFLFLPVVWHVIRYSQVRQRAVTGIRALVFLLVLFGMIACFRASLWGDGVQQALVWSERSPGSFRAQHQAALAWNAMGLPERAEGLIRQRYEENPTDSKYVLIGLELMCGTGTSEYWLEASRRIFPYSSIWGAMIKEIFDGLLRRIKSGSCPDVTARDAITLLDLLIANPAASLRKTNLQVLYHFRGRAYLMLDDVDLAYEDFIRAIDQSGVAEGALSAAGILGMAGYPDKGLELLEYWETQGALLDASGNIASTRLVGDYLMQEVGRMRQQLHNDLRDPGVRPISVHQESEP